MAFRFLVVVAVLAGTAGLGSAQITGTLRGTVTDSQGAVLPGATVTVTGTALRRGDVFEVSGAEGR
ncbi:MAG: hypothetical protein FJW23_17335, partial [Acidimicrobiia bacterium]|nr:hypothetical protein [Acidimicrobiia bacterium]